MTLVKENHLRIYWSAIAVGVIVVIAAQSLFNFLALGLGLIAFSPSMDSLKQLSLIFVIWLMATNMIALFLGGWLSGMCNPSHQKLYGALHGLMVWALAMMLTFILMASAAGMLINSGLSTLSQGLSLAGKEAFSGLSTVASTAGSLVKPVLEPVLDNATEQAREMVDTISWSVNPDSDSKQASDTMKQRLIKLVVQLSNAPTGNDVQAIRQQINTFLMKNTGLSQSQIDQKVSDWQQTYSNLKEQANQKAMQAKQKAIEAANQTSNVLGKLSLLFFAVLFMGAVAASLGGIWAINRSDR